LGFSSYEFQGDDTPGEERVHIEGCEYSKNKLAPMYGTSKFDAWKAHGLYQLYNILHRIFRGSIAPSYINLDDHRGGLVNLVYYSH
jgi:hypothetical protein